jgi:surfeit locus 1 family protein
MLFCAFALIAAALFIRLGFWQLSRLGERRTRNAAIAEQQLRAPMPLAALPHDTAQAHYRHASVNGRYDFDHELVLTNRTRRGSPGVELITPVRVSGSDTAVLVNRGWVYSPDGGTVDHAKWREPDTAHVAGYVELFTPDAGVTSTRDPRAIRRMTRSEAASKIPYPVAPFYLVSVGDTADLTHPARHEMPVLDDGPHQSYAMQWFSFAAIAIIGAGVVIARERRGA